MMATQFCDMMLAKKKRTPRPNFLAQGLRLMCDVYLIAKADESMASIKRMHSERKTQ